MQWVAAEGKHWQPPTFLLVCPLWGELLLHRRARKANVWRECSRQTPLESDLPPQWAQAITAQRCSVSGSRSSAHPAQRTH